MSIATAVFVLVFVTVLVISGWIIVWKEAKAKVAAQKIIEQMILPPEEQKHSGLFNAGLY